MRSETEMQIVYHGSAAPSSKKLDFTVSVAKVVLPVSVTRAIQFEVVLDEYQGKRRLHSPLQRRDARRLLAKKIAGLRAARANAARSALWANRSLLCVWTANHHDSVVLVREWLRLQSSVVAAAGNRGRSASSSSADAPNILLIIQAGFTGSLSHSYVFGDSLA